MEKVNQLSCQLLNKRSCDFLTPIMIVTRFDRGHIKVIYRWDTGYLASVSSYLSCEVNYFHRISLFIEKILVSQDI